MAPQAARFRVGFDAVRALRNQSGLGNYARLLLSGLRQVAPDLQFLLYSPRPPIARYHRFPLDIRAELRLPPPGQRGVPLRQIWRTLQLGRTARRDRLDLFHGLSHEIPRDLPRLGIPTVVTSLDLLYLTHPRLFPLADRISYRCRYGWSLHHANAIVAISEWTRQQIHHYYRIPLERIVVIPPARDPGFSQPAPPSEREAAQLRYQLPPEYLIAVGTLEPRKNQRLAIEAMALLPPDIPPLLLVGRDGGSAAELRRLIAMHHLEQRVLIRTEITQHDLVTLVQGARVALYLSLAEGFGMPIIEAMSAGVPVIAADGPHLRDAGGEAACYVPADDPASLAAAITHLLAHPETVRRYQRLGLSHSAAFEPFKLAQRLLSVYHAVLSNPSDPDLASIPYFNQETSQ